MGAATGQLGRWTRYFTVASAFALVALAGVGAAGANRRVLGVVGLFGFVSPMIFGMAYLLLPSYVGRTLAHQRLPGLHFVATYLGAGLLVAGAAGVSSAALLAGAVSWSLGVTVFLGSLAWTIVPTVLDRPAVVLRSDDRPQRSTRVAAVTIPAALGYLLVGTLGLLSLAGGLPSPVPVTLPRVLHAFGAGFGALLVFSLGVRLLVGFFHVDLPRHATRLVLVTGAVGPFLLATHLWGGAWFRVGAVVEASAMLGYASLVGYVATRSAWNRVGLYGVALGAGAGAVAVLLALSVALGTVDAGVIDGHPTLILQGFFALTVVGYAYQFFPVTTGRFRGASERGALATILALAAGVAVQGVGAAVHADAVRVVGGVLSLVGATGYAYLITRRLLGE